MKSHSGIVTWFNVARGYGFIRSVDDNHLVTNFFFTLSNIEKLQGDVEIGATAYFNVGERTRDKAPALNIEIAPKVVSL